jgi:hypothetical protein
MDNLIDRRLNPGNKSIGNRERFLRRYKAQIKKSVQDMIAERGVTDMHGGGNVNIPSKDIGEPAFRHGAGGDHETVLPGNEDFSKGDTLKRPGGGNGTGSGAGDSESGLDEFSFALTREEFMHLFFDGMELPDLIKTILSDNDHITWKRSGYANHGTPSNLSTIRTLKMAIGRRVALTGPLSEQLTQAQEALVQALERGQDCETLRLREQIIELEARIASVPFLEDIDLRFRNRLRAPTPAVSAVMFCLMDVSASMDEDKKDLAKRFFTLLHLFLTQKYKKVDIVFIRHTTTAEEVDEHEFFHGQQNGGTVVLSALRLMREVVAKRYPPALWNIYGAQASDGDAFGVDGVQSTQFLKKSLLPLIRFFAYLDVPDRSTAGNSPLWSAYEALLEKNFAMRRACEKKDVYPVLREFFHKESA